VHVSYKEEAARRERRVVRKYASTFRVRGDTARIRAGTAHVYRGCVISARARRWCGRHGDGGDMRGPRMCWSRGGSLPRVCVRSAEELRVIRQVLLLSPRELGLRQCAEARGVRRARQVIRHESCALKDGGGAGKRKGARGRLVPRECLQKLFDGGGAGEHERREPLRLGHRARSVAVMCRKYDMLHHWRCGRGGRGRRVGAGRGRLGWREEGVD
jgi:hypothetical protein